VADITAEQLAAAESDYRDLKASTDDVEERATAAEALTQLRTAYREQEITAGRRFSLVNVED
jgi:hypothetical protein